MDLDYYRSAGPLTELDLAQRELVDAIPADPVQLCAAAQGLLVLPTPGSQWSRCSVLAEMNRHSPILVVEHGDELEACAECFEVLAQGGHADVVGVLQLGDRPLGDVQKSGELGLADCLGVAELGEPDLFERLGAEGCESLLRAQTHPGAGWPAGAD